MWKAVKCPCNHSRCNSWMVEPVAALQGLSMTEAEAHVMAASYNLLDVLKEAKTHLDYVGYERDPRQGPTNSNPESRSLEEKIADVLLSAEPPHFKKD